jgi:enoyl-CoA hydratase/carnithine racemase
VLDALDAHQLAAKEKSILAVIDAAFESADYQEGSRAFLEKRSPVFVGH